MSASGEDGSRSARQRCLVRLVYRLVLLQAAAAAAVGLPFSRRHVPSVVITVFLVLAVLLLAWVSRAGTRGAWMTAFAFECTFFVFGLSRFVSARYVGGTLSAAVLVLTLLHPAVARAYGVLPARLAGRTGGDVALGEAAQDTLSGGTAG